MVLRHHREKENRIVAATKGSYVKQMVNQAIMITLFYETLASFVYLKITVFKENPDFKRKL